MKNLNISNQLPLPGIHFDYDPYLKKKAFLNSLISNSKNWKYVRYIASPLRYAGGKSLAVGHIIEYLPDNLEVLVSPFIGGASIEIACAKELGIRVYGYDIFDILTNYWQVQLTARQELVNKLSQWIPGKEQYKKIKERLREHWDNEQKIEDPIDLAAHYWFNHNLSYGPAFLGWTSKTYLCKKLYFRYLNTISNFECPLLSVECLSFEESIEKHKTDFLYCDPPYYLEEGKVFTGIYPQRNFPVHHKGFRHDLLRDLLYSHKNRFILSYNDCEIIREWYSGFKIIEVKWQYTLGQGETRIGKNRVENKADHTKKSSELLIIKD